MRFTIQHETIYSYTSPVHYSIQQLRLTPRIDQNQRALSWQITAPGPLQRSIDAYGNITHTMVLRAPHNEIRMLVNGSLEIEPLRDGHVPTTNDMPGSELSPLVYTVATPLTTADDSVRAFAARHLARDRRATNFVALAEAICDAVQYQSGITEVTSTAAQALAIGQGVCQDHAHLFLACCRANNVPARYVSGYIHPGDTTHAASHAWADVWVEDKGWISIDITHRQYAGERHCRLALGRDYMSAAPIRGVRTGGGDESLEVRVAVRTDQ
ncbi:MAG: transglutaminase family protein [Gammaproteobacteria bacterium]|nr:transglutaminase family protein [Gammaproteobacteria bacterium]